MKTRMLLIIGLLALFSLIVVAASKSIVSDPSIPFQTIEQGDISYYRYGDANFTGADLLITKNDTWAWFWNLHTAGIEPKPPLPSVKFPKEIVIATILGFQTTGGGPNIKVLNVSVDPACECLRVLIEDNETAGPLDVITNPFHIIKFKRPLPLPRSVVFEHQKP